MTRHSTLLNLAVAASLAAGPGAAAMGFQPTSRPPRPPRTPTPLDHQRFADAQNRRDRRAARNLRRLGGRS